MRSLLAFEDICKNYGNFAALKNISLEVFSGKVLCVLGDNGAGKSTLIKIISGAHKHDSGLIKFNGKICEFNSPQDALKLGIATVYQDLAVVSLMPVWRNFFLGREIVKKSFLNRSLDISTMRTIAKDSLIKMGIELPNVDQPIGKLSGGQRQCVAIARAIHFGAKVLILDEPTAALGVKQSGIVLKQILQAKKQGIGVVFVTHNPGHAYLVGDNFILLQLGSLAQSLAKTETDMQRLVYLMSGGSQLTDLETELEAMR